jgi:glutamate/tyrosine decarboxylase-like PLP-dependent enzyme
MSDPMYNLIDLDQSWYANEELLAHSLQRISQDAISLLVQDHDKPVRASLNPQEVIQKLNLTLPTQTQDLNQVLNHIVKILSHSPSTSGPAFFNQLFAGRDPVATPVEMLTALMNHSMYTYKLAGPLVIIEDLLIKAMGEQVGYSKVSGIFTPGGSLSNLTAILCARETHFPNAKEEGMPAGIRIYTSAESHYSIRKAAGLTGVGRQNVQFIPVDSQGRMLVDALEKAIIQDITAGFIPMMINATAGTTVRGAFDLFSEIAQIAHKYQIWFHIDAAFGGTSLWSKELSAYMQDAHLADSVTWDAHKAMGVPLTCSVFLTHHLGIINQALSEHASYLFQEDDNALNPGTRSLQCGRRNDALKLWAAWKYYGTEGWSQRIDRQRALALKLAELVSNHPRLVLIEAPPYLNVCFYHLDMDSQMICHHLQHEQHALIGYADVQERCIIRAAVINPCLQNKDLIQLIDAIDLVATCHKN